MSRITNVLLLADGLAGPAFDEFLEEIRHWRYQRRYYPLASLEAPTLPPLWYGGDRPLEAGLALGALNHLALEPYLAFLRRLPWDEHACTVQLAVKEQDADGFRLHPIHPVPHAPPDAVRDEALAAIAAQFGKLELGDDLPELAPDLDALDEACRRYLATRGYLFGPERA